MIVDRQFPLRTIAKYRPSPYPPRVSESSNDIDIAIVGAGAAGLAAGIFAGESAHGRQRSIVILDGAKSIGAKILVSGGGRCNVTHDSVYPTDFFGNRHIIKNVLASFSVDRTVAWFDSLGVELKREETGKLFPVSNQARTVLAALLDRCRALGVHVLSHHRVMGVERGESGLFWIHHARGEIRARRIILATGGRSLPKTGSDGFGYELARTLGHTVTSTAPALVPLVLAPSMFHATLSGLSQNVELTTVVGGKRVDRRIGSLLWTHFGISGPVVMDASRFWTLARLKGESAELYGNFLPGTSPDEARTWFLGEAAAHPRRSLGTTLAQRVPEAFGAALCGYLTLDVTKAAAQVTRTDRERLCNALVGFPFPIERDRGGTMPK